ncbi:hypothetical protein SERV_ORF50 [short-finned eel virus]|uniref:Uncharacterized protein n=1 Tax=short-finned eel virus TaxID=2848076 RepID=A0A192GQA4_FRG3V|nr:hypothetical protein SERV_ORF50 [Short-finned eel ranavirus]ANK58098.1 hypothetical protein SERV_ORF50 [Short-finned eel ranavirus]
MMGRKRLSRAARYISFCLQISITMLSRIEWIASRMTAYPQGGLISPCNITELAAEVIDSLLDGNPSLLVIFAQTQKRVEALRESTSRRVYTAAGQAAALGGPKVMCSSSLIKRHTQLPSGTRMVIADKGFRPKSVGPEFRRHLKSAPYPLWIVYDPTCAKSRVAMLDARTLWNPSTSLPYLYQQPHVTDVAVYDQPPSEMYVSMLHTAVVELELKNAGDVEEMLFMPHLAYTRVIMTEPKHMRACAEAESVADLKAIPHEYRLHPGEAAAAMIRGSATSAFRGAPFGHAELLSDPDRVYSCDLALRSELEKVPRGTAVVVVRNAQYVAYAGLWLPVWPPSRPLQRWKRIGELTGPCFCPWGLAFLPSGKEAHRQDDQRTQGSESGGFRAREKPHMRYLQKQALHSGHQEQTLLGRDVYFLSCRNERK